MLQLPLLLLLSASGAHGAWGAHSKSSLAEMKVDFPASSFTQQPNGRENLARDYSDAYSKADGPAENPEFYGAFEIQMSKTDRYKPLVKVGSGTFGTVFRGIDVERGRECAIKIPEKRSSWRLKRELYVMKVLQGGTNIIQLLDVVEDDETHRPVLIMEYMNNTMFDVRSILQPVEVKIYMYKLLQALDYAHSKGIIHRDLKPRNVMVDPDTGKLRLLDWNIAERYIPGNKYSMRVSTLQYKAPELLVNHAEYTYSLDMWGFGTCLGMFVFQRDRLIMSDSIPEQLHKTAEILGTADLYKYLEKYSITPSDEIKAFLGELPKKGWNSMLDNSNSRFASQYAIDLLEKLLTWDPQERLTAREAMEHKYFDEIRSLQLTTTAVRRHEEQREHGFGSIKSGSLWRRLRG